MYVYIHTYIPIYIYTYTHIHTYMLLILLHSPVIRTYHMMSPIDPAGTSPGSQDAAACPGKDRGSTFCCGHAGTSHAGAKAGAGEAASGGRGPGGLWTVPWEKKKHKIHDDKRM